MIPNMFVRVLNYLNIIVCFFSLNKYNMYVRINKYLASCGISSRRKCEQLVVDGRVTVNGIVIHDLSTNVGDSDIVCFDGKQVTLFKEKIYLMLNKPVCYISAVSDNRGRKVVTDLVPKKFGNVFPVGRLDYNTQGLLLLTNDGEFANKIIHPRSNIKKTYKVYTNILPKTEQLKKLRSGMTVGDIKYMPAIVSSPCKENDMYVFDIVITEGKNREIRNMCGAVGIRVIMLIRTAIGNLKLNDLPVGKIKRLSNEELKLLEEYDNYCN